MRPYLLIAVLALMLPPLAAHAQEVHEEPVQEPDAEDNAMPPESMLGGAIPETPLTQQQPVGMPGADGKIAATPASTTPQPPLGTGDTNFDVVMLQGLNKVTARAQPIEVPIGSAIRYGTIEIIAHKCWKSAPEDRPENAALLEVSEIKQGEAPQRIFSGWMFSSSPGLSSLEHPFYDITVTACSKEAAKP